MERNPLIDVEQITLDTDFPIATNSPDHLYPCGTAQDNSVNLRFNYKLSQLYGSSLFSRAILDLGCAGGGAVKSYLDMGVLSVGIEGSNYSAKLQRGLWPFLHGKMLFTADITKPFQVQYISQAEKRKMKFDVITLWEVFEHIQEKDLFILLSNILTHLKEDGLLFVSIAVFEFFSYHQTVKSKKWWINLFQNYNLAPAESLMKYFNGQYIRGEKLGDKGSFNLILSRHPFSLTPPTKKWLHHCFDCWNGSAIHRLLAKKLIGFDPFKY